MSTYDNRKRFEELRKRLLEPSGSREKPASGSETTGSEAASQTGSDDAKRRFEEMRASLKKTTENQVSPETWNEDDWKRDREFIDSFIADSQKYMTDSARVFDGISYSEATDQQLRDERRKTRRDLNSRADTAVEYINKYKDVIGEEQYARLIGYIQNFRSNRLHIASAYNNQEQYYGQWESEDAYNLHQIAQPLMQGAGTLIETESEQQDYQTQIVDTKTELAEMNARRNELAQRAELDHQESTAAKLPPTNRDNNPLNSLNVGTTTQPQPKQNNANRNMAAAQPYNMGVGAYTRNEKKYVPGQYDTSGNDMANAWLPDTKEFSEIDKEIIKLDMQIREKETHLQMLEQAERQQKRGTRRAELEQVAKEDDFDEYKGYQSTKTDAWHAWITTESGMGYGDLTYEYINDTPGVRHKVRGLARNASGYSNPISEKNYDMMTPEEVEIYNYLYRKKGKETAEEYLHLLQDDLNKRLGDRVGGVIKGHTALEIGYGFYAGVDQFAQGMKNAVNFTDDYIPVSAAQYAGQVVREDLADDGFNLPEWLGGGSIAQVGYDFASTTGNMLPSIALNMAAPGAGTVTMGVSAAGNAYQDMLNQGYSMEQARAYSTLVGLSEVGLEKILNGIPQMGKGMLSEKALQNLAKLDNVFGRVAMSHGGQFLAGMTSEGFEEGLQEILEPMIKAAVTGEAAEIEWENVLYSYLLGSMSGGTFQGIDIAGKDIKTAKAQYQTGKTINSTDGGVDALRKLANEMAGVSSEDMQNAITKQTGKMDKKATNRRVGKLFDTVNTANNLNNASANQADIAKSLQRKGFTAEKANAVAEALVASYNGQNLTSAQQKLLESVKDNADVRKAIDSIMYNSKSTMGQRSQNIRTFENDIRAGVISKKTGISMEEARNIVEGKFVPQEKSLAENSYEVSADGKTIDKDGNLVSIQGIASIENGRMVLQTEGGTVDAKDVIYGNRSEALVYEAVANLGDIIDTETANKLAEHLMKLGETSSEGYVQGIVEAYRCGYYGYSRDKMTGKKAMAATLTEKQRNVAYGRGQWYRDAQTKAEQAKKTAEKKGSSKKDDGVFFQNDKGEVVSYDESGIKTKATREAGVQTAKVLKKLGLGGRFVFFESHKNADGKWVYTDTDGNVVEAPNGMYYKDGTVYVDLNAGKGGAGLTLFTLSHELTHFIQQWSPAKYKALADFLIREYEKTGLDVDALVHAKQQDLSENRGEKVSYDEAFHEMVADSMEKMFADGNLVQKLMKLKAQDNSLFGKIKGFVDKLARKIRWYYGSLNPDSFEGRMVGQMSDAIGEIQDKFAEALVEASENYQTDLTPGEEGVVVNESGDPVAYTTGDGTVQLSMKTYEDDGRAAFRKYLQKCVNSNKLTKTEMQEMLDGIEEIYGVCKEFKDKFAPFSAWSDASVVRDTHGRPVFSVVTPNGDYKMNLDFSLVCKKRRTLDAVFNEMSRRGIIDDFELGQKSVVKINEIIRKYGLETACALCFVDAKRFRQASMADSFTRLYNELVESLVPEDQKGSIDHFNFSGYSTIKKVEGGIDTWDNSKLDFSHLDYVMKHYGNGTVEHKAAKYIKTHAEGRKLLLRGDFMSSQGFDAVKTQNKDILKLYNSKKGTGGPKAAFGDVQYMNEIIRKARTWTPAKAYAVGGVRIQSFSDYVPRMVFDYVQMIYDLAATKLPAHAYTKEALFVKQFGLTGIKINMSLIPAIAEGGIAPGLDANGNYVWAGESFDYETAKQIQNAEGYTENCGTICVGVSYEHIKKLLNDPNIRMVIPYHKSGLNPIVAHMNKIAEFTDYTNDQRTKGKDGKALSKDFDFSKAMHDMGANASPKAVADQYLKWCVANGYTARFAEFAAEENYYKLLEDFTLYDKDGNYVPQREVRAVFPKETDAFGSMKDLIHEGLEEDAIVEGKRDKNLSAIVDEIQRTLPKTEAEIAAEQVEQADRDLEAKPQYSIRKDIVDVNGKEYDTVVALDKPVRKNVLSSPKELMGYIKRNFIGLQIPVLDGNGNTEIIEFARENETVVKNKKRHPVLGELGYIKGDTRKVVVVNLKEVLEESDYDPIYSSSDNEHGWLDERGWESRKTYVLTDNIIYEAFLKIAKARDGRNILYGVNLDVKKGIAVDQGATSKRAAVLAAMPSGNKVTQPDPKVKQNSDRDSDGNQLTKEQQEFFKESKVRDKDGNLMIVYHGTNQGDFTEFLWDKTQRADGGFYGRGHYFTASKGMAEIYGARLIKGYLNIENPFVWKEEINSYQGREITNIQARNIAVRINMARVFPDLFANKTMGYGTFNYRTEKMEEKTIRWSELEKEITKTAGTLKPLVFSDGSVQWAYPGDFWDHNVGDRYASMEEAEMHKFEAAVQAFIDTHTGIAYYMTVDDQTTWTQDYGSEISDSLMSLGYDGAMQDRSGTEIVAFRSNQFKNADNTNPTTNSDFRYSDRADESVSNRSLLANAFEGLVQNDIERKRLQEYKSKIDLINAEEQKLRKLNEQIKELSFAKGPRDTKAIRDLQDEAKKTANRINIYDTQLLRLEASKPLQNVLEREKKKAYQRAEKKGKEALEAYREKSVKAQREMLDRWQESRKKGVEGRHKTAMRHKIQSFKKRLESSLLKPTDRRYVPIDLIKAMVEVCDLIDTDTELYKDDGSINKAQEKRNLTKEKLQNLRDEYEKLKTPSDPIYAGEFDEMVYTYLTELRDKYAGKNLKEMNLDELTEMYEILRSIEETLQDARKLIGWGDAENVYEAGDAIVDEQNQITQSRKGGKRNAAQIARDKSLNLSLSPVRNVERMSGYNQDSYLLKMFKKIEQGIRKKNKFRMEAYKSFEELTSGKEYDDAIYKEVGGKKYTDVKGRKFGVSKMQMMQAILSYERENANNLHHIENGGFTFADLEMLRKGNLRNAISAEYSHRVPAAVKLVAEFAEVLKNDQWCQDYMAAARKFFNGMAKDAINETSIALKHRIIAKDKNYIPFEVDRNFINLEISAEQKIQQTISSYGMLKDTKDNAPQSLIVTGLNNVIDRHIDLVGNVYGLAIEIRNYNKVWNARSRDTVGYDLTVKEVIETNWGKEGVEHIEQAVQDVQGPRRSEQSELYKKVKSGYISATFLLNLSVVTKQIGSLFSATSMLKWRGPIRQIGNLLYTMANHKKISAEVDKYTATAWMRRQGLSDAELHTFMTEGKKTWIGRVVGKLPAVANPGKWITAMDSAVALSLWRYAKTDTAKRTGLKGEELLKATAEFYDEVIENTQSMNDVLHRPEIQKRSDILSESLGMFKTDLYQMAGQLQVTAGRFAANKTKANGMALVRTVYSVAMSAVWGQLMTTVFALLRYKVNQYRDDEDKELTYESWLKRQGFGFAGDLLGYIFPLFGSETIGFFEHIMYGESEEIVDSLALTALNDLYDMMITVGSSVKDGEMPKPEDMKKLTIKALQCFGIPANNIIRTYEAIHLHAKDIANGEFLSFEAGIDRTPKHHIHRIVEAMGEGKPDVALGLYEEALEETALDIRRENLEKMGMPDDGSYGEKELEQAKSSLKTALGNKFKDGEISEEQAVDILVKCFGLDKDDAKQDVGEWAFKVKYGVAWSDRSYAYVEGKITRSELKAAIMDLEDKTEEEADTYIDDLDFEARHGFAYDECKQMFLNGEISAAEAKSYIMTVDEKTSEEAEERVKEWTFRKEYGFEYSDRSKAYKSGSISKHELKKILIDFGGKTEEEADLQIQAYDWEVQGYEGVTLAAVREYNNYCATVRVPKDVYLHIRKFANNTENDVDEVTGKTINYSAMKKIMAEIGKQTGLTDAQKDAIARSLGWKEKNIKKYKTW